MLMQPRGRVLVLIDLVQDVDVLLPVLLAARQAKLFGLDIRVSRWLAGASPRTAALLRQARLRFRWTLRGRVIAGKAPDLQGVGALLTASESSASPHRAGYGLALRARSHGIPTFTLQHGLRNTALVPEADGSFAAFASDHVMTWSAEPPPPPPPPDTLAKIMPVGRPALPADVRTDFDLAVFENLHSDDYGDEDRLTFLAGLRAVATSQDQPSILIRSHPAGGWLDPMLSSLARPGVVTVSSAQARRSLSGGGQAAVAARRVITTPSTIALDAALAGKPVAIAGHRKSVVFSCLPHLISVEDWRDFAFMPVDPAPASRFVTAVGLLPGDASHRVVLHLAAALA